MAEAFERDLSSEGKGARSTIFFVVRDDNESIGSGKGVLSMPILGVIINFWCSGGMESSAWTWEERSVMVEVEEKEKV